MFADDGRIWVVVPFAVCIALGSFIANALGRATAVEIAYKEHLEAVGGDDTVASKAGPAKGLAGTNVVSSHSAHTTSSMPSTKILSKSVTYPSPLPGAALPITFTPRYLPVVIVGSNRLAATRIFTFLEAEADIMVASPTPLSEAHPEIQHRVTTSAVRFTHFSPSDLLSWAKFLSKKNVALVCVTDTLIGSSVRRSHPSAAVIYQAATSLHIPINISDYPELSTYTFPSVHRFAGVDGQPSSLQIAISTNGNGCRLASRIRREIVTKLPPSVGTAVDNVGRLRQRAKSRSKANVSEDDLDTPLNTPVPQLDTPSLLSHASKQLGEVVASSAQTQMRRMRWVQQMSEYYPFDKLARMSDRDMDEALATWDDTENPLPHHQADSSKSGSDWNGNAIDGTGKGKGKIFLVGSGPGHPGLLTLAAHQILLSATVILSDKLVPSEILALIPSTTKLHIAKKFPGNNEGAQNEIMTQAVTYARQGETVVRLKQGDPFVYGRGGEEVLYFREEGFECTLIPGVSSALAGPQMMGIPVTQRGVAESMILCTGVGRAGKAVQLPGYIKSRTLVILMGVARIRQIVDVLTNPEAEGRDGECFPKYLPIAVIERASSPDQRAVMSTLGDIEEALGQVEERPPGMMLVGWAVGCLEKKGEVGILDMVEERSSGEEAERQVVKRWLGDGRWKIREGLSEEWRDLIGADVPVV
jgi:uroporphyrin-III C-methyltransferase